MFFESFDSSSIIFSFFDEEGSDVTSQLPKGIPS